MAYQCPICHKILKTKKSLRSHQATQHPPEAPVEAFPPKMQKAVRVLRAKGVKIDLVQIGKGDKKIQTQTAINLFINDCRDKGLAEGTIGTRISHLKHFELEFPELPTEFLAINRFLTRVIKKKNARYHVRKSLLAFYKFLETQNILDKNPIPKLKVGRPRKISPKAPEKLGRGGSNFPSQRIELHIYLHQAAD